MDSNTILENIITSGIFDAYQAQDQSLHIIIDSIQRKKINSAVLKNIAFTRKAMPAQAIELIFRRRLSHIPDEVQSSLEDRDELTQLRSAIMQLVEYCKYHGEAKIYGIIFHASKYSYHVHFAISGKRVEVICVIRGRNPIPDF